MLTRIKEVIFNEEILKDIVKNLNIQRKDVIVPLEREQEQLTKSLKDLENRKNRVFELYEDSTIDKQTLAHRIENITAEIATQSKRRIQIEKELESNDSVNIPYEVVKDTLSNFHKLIEIAAPEDKKTLLQLIINNNEGQSRDDGGSPSFILFTIVI
ncbi:hypothetical protein C7M56_10500 [Clostridium botulinum]|uniref:Uncharacterized protein n=1 Tax=Clostridium botulinum TaxID=1491 RepID=A0ABC8CUI5_CLOBO|nr:hypothetical protein [Clostridium botulinum]AVQ39095.1 hypothetical protein C7M56_10500 [Clostridium botulinum]